MQPEAIYIRVFIKVSCLLILLVSSLSFADSAPDKVDVRLVIDVSGSMKGNDPNNLRQPAVELLVELLPEGSRAGVWTFGKWVNMLIPHKDVGPEWREVARAKAKDISSVGLYTNIGEALEKAAYDIAYSESEHKKNIILLTDGMVDIDKAPDKNRDEWRRIVDDVIPKLKDAGIRVHTIALSKNADRDLMDRLAVATDGLADTAESADDLMKIFLQAFDAAVPSEQVSLVDNQFLVDSSVEEFTALIFRKQGSEQTQVITPDQKTWQESSSHPDLRWHRTDSYDLITVKRPLEGAWGVVGEIDPDSRVTVVSNLNLRLKPLPNNVLKGTELDLSVLLQEDGQTITKPEFLSLMDLKAELFGGNSFDELVSIWDQPLKQSSPAEGRYETRLPALKKEGVYQLKVHVDGKTFSRELKHQITLRQAFSADVREQFEDGSLRYVLTVNAYQQGINYSKTQVIAAVTMPNGQKLVEPLSISELDTWQGVVEPSSEGQYSARVQVKGVTVDGEIFEYELDPMNFSYSAEGGMVEAKPSFEEELPSEAPPPKEEVSEPKVEPKPEPEQTPADETTTEVPEEQPSGLPSWIMYVALGVGNLLLFGIGFLVFKKLVSGPKQDVLDELETEHSEDSTSKPEGEESALEAPAEQDEEEDEEEPPMEDLDPESAVDEESAEEVPLSDTTVFDELPDDEIETLEPESNEPAMEEESEPEDDFIDIPADDGSDGQSVDEAGQADDDMDDLDAMAMEIEEGAAAEQADDSSEKAEEDEDMVSAMLKAQGLDLAEEELDDAISSLIDDLEEDDDDEEEKK